MKSDTERQISYYIAFMCNLKKKKVNINLFTKRSGVTNIENKLLVSRGSGREEIRREGLTYTHVQIHIYIYTSLHLK